MMLVNYCSDFRVVTVFIVGLGVELVVQIWLSLLTFVQSILAAIVSWYIKQKVRIENLSHQIRT